jgi:hypothetical protein
MEWKKKLTNMADRGAFENILHYFVKALHVLSSDAATQCKDMDNYNTPSEIRNCHEPSRLGAIAPTGCSVTGGAAYRS